MSHGRVRGAPESTTAYIQRWRQNGRPTSSGGEVGLVPPAAVVGAAVPTLERRQRGKPLAHLPGCARRALSRPDQKSFVRTGATVLTVKGACGVATAIGRVDP
jgi:hypothetical protein